MFKQFDIVRIKTTKNVTWISLPPGKQVKDIDPNGYWSVVGSIGIYLIICKESTLVRIPYDDVEKVASYNIDKFIEDKTNGQTQE